VFIGYTVDFRFGIMNAKSWPNKIAAANRHRPFRFDLNMKLDHHHSRLSPQPVAVAEL
jgi:hypothetical protein